MADRHGACIVSALVCVCIGLAWQVLTVHYNYGGNWTGLFITGSQFPIPPSLASENLYVFPNSTGYDGQMYHYVAHDPLMQKGFGDFVDNARLRYRRILLPALAFILAPDGSQPLMPHLSPPIFCFYFWVHGGSAGILSSQDKARPCQSCLCLCRRS
jgi:hypothetical protein